MKVGASAGSTSSPTRVRLVPAPSTSAPTSVLLRIIFGAFVAIFSVRTIALSALCADPVVAGRSVVALVGVFAAPAFVTVGPSGKVVFAAS